MLTQLPDPTDVTICQLHSFRVDLGPAWFSVLFDPFGISLEGSYEKMNAHKLSLVADVIVTCDSCTNISVAALRCCRAKKWINRANDWWHVSLLAKKQKKQTSATINNDLKKKKEINTQTHCEQIEN